MISTRQFCGYLAVVLSAYGCARDSGFFEGSYKDKAEYMQARQRLVDAESAIRFDHGLELSGQEQQANRRLVELREREIERAQGYFPPAYNFLKAKHVIDKSPVLEVMKRMPKGGILHAHAGANVDFRWLVSYATYLPGCYIYTVEREKGPAKGSLRFFQDGPGEGWEPVSSLRQKAENVSDFDEQIYRSLTLGPEDANVSYLWPEFDDCFARFIWAILYLPVYKEFCRKTVEEMVGENVQYAELRGVPGHVYDLDETVYNEQACLDIFRGILDEVRVRQPELKVKFIDGCVRTVTRERLGRYLQEALELKQKYPDFVVGFDLVGEEDKLHKNLYYIDELLDIQRARSKESVSLPLYLHSGESNRADNENLYDAILLNSKRIGHGLALSRHPLLMQIVKERDIAIEVCPISNQVLGYVSDLRNHPAVDFMSRGLPVVLCPDDPGIMRCTFSHDFYEAFMAWELDLKSLKQLAINSLQYSAMSRSEKQRAMQVWRKKWDEFIQWINEADFDNIGVVKGQ